MSVFRTSEMRYFCSRLSPPSLARAAAAFSTSNGSRVGTHSGSFHCDEALACFILRHTDKFRNAEIIRTRDPQVLDSLDAAVDVGGVYDPRRDRYDHHQRGFEEVFGHGFATKLSSAGLVYKHYGKELLTRELQLDQEHHDVNKLFIAIYKNFMEAIDETDNGISEYETRQQPRYVNKTSLSSRVGRLNLDWVDPDHSSGKEDEAFQHAMRLAGSEFMESVHFHARSWLPARSIVTECISMRNNIDPSGEIIVLNRSCPWKLHIFELEEEMGIDPNIKYVIYQDDRSGRWRLQAVAISFSNFQSRKPMPVAWRGLEGDELSAVAGIPGCVFAHMSGFIGGNKTYEGALAMSRASLHAA
ncbi:hypothetical protein SAY87_017508 [Trapa incisa]|uniref:Metal-dependent protein hydrolase n=1 Tax=Trapa incisa TaxID=236973 RepID=A0AAN7LA12_9MYRT|nr:hypothetical protein SAY87_017508 [Trapa incisa]